MTDQQQHDDAQAQDDAVETEPAAAGDEVGALQAELARREAEVAELKDRLLRATAEFDNVRKRLRREAEESGTRAVARFVKGILNEIDNLGRAIEAARPDAFAEFAQGVVMTRDNLRSALAAAGIEQVSEEGIFDPAVHEVIGEAERADLPKGTIVAVNRAGYRLKDQVVRAAQVVVARPPAAG